MGKSLIIKGADFSAVAVTHINLLSINISNGGVVTITSDSSNDIYYTIDNSIPTLNSTKYSGQFVIALGITVKAINKFTDGTTSEVVSKTYATFNYQLSNAKIQTQYSFGSINEDSIVSCGINPLRGIILTNLEDNSVRVSNDFSDGYIYLISIPNGITSIKERHSSTTNGVACATVSVKDKTFTPGEWNNQSNTDFIIDVTGKSHLAISISMVNGSEVPKTLTLADIGLTLTDNS